MSIAGRYPGIGVCPICGAPAVGVGRSGAYCGDDHYAEARHRALAGIAWEPAPTFADAARRPINIEKPRPVSVTRYRTRHRRAQHPKTT